MSSSSFDCLKKLSEGRKSLPDTHICKSVVYISSLVIYAQQAPGPAEHVIGTEPFTSRKLALLQIICNVEQK